MEGIVFLSENSIFEMNRYKSCNQSPTEISSGFPSEPTPPDDIITTFFHCVFVTYNSLVDHSFPLYPVYFVKAQSFAQVVDLYINFMCRLWRLRSLSFLELQHFSPLSCQILLIICDLFYCFVVI